MTVAEMIIGVNLGVQKVDAQTFDDLQTEEAEYYLNKSVRDFIRRQNLALRQSFIQAADDIERKAEVIENLGPILVTDVIGNSNISAYSNFGNAKAFAVSNLSETLFHYTFSQTQIANAGSWRANLLITPDMIPLFMDSSSNKAVFRDYPILRIANNFVIFYDAEGNDVYDVAITYVKKPATLVASGAGAGEVTTSELPEHTHDAIVDLAVSMILEDFKSARPHQPTQTITTDEGT